MVSQSTQITKPSPFTNYTCYHFVLMVISKRILGDATIFEMHIIKMSVLFYLLRKEDVPFYRLPEEDVLFYLSICCWHSVPHCPPSLTSSCWLPWTPPPPPLHTTRSNNTTSAIKNLFLVIKFCFERLFKERCAREKGPKSLFKSDAVLWDNFSLWFVTPYKLAAFNEQTCQDKDQNVIFPLNCPHRWGTIL